MSVCILEQIAQAVKAALDELVTAGVASAVERPRRVGMPDNPKDNLLYLIQDDPIEDTETQTFGMKAWVQPFVVICFVRPSDAAATPVDTAINELRAQVEMKLREHAKFGGLATDTRIQPPEGFATGDGSAGVAVIVHVLYRTREDDPYSLS